MFVGSLGSTMSVMSRQYHVSGKFRQYPVSDVKAVPAAMMLRQYHVSNAGAVPCQRRCRHCHANMMLSKHDVSDVQAARTATRGCAV